MGLYLKIINDGTGTKKIGNYDYEIRINKKIISKGKLNKFHRHKGALNLIKNVQEIAKENEYATALGKLMAYIKKEDE